MYKMSKVIFVSVMCSCRPIETTDVKNNWFEYYDLFTLQGKSPLAEKGFNYPYVSIDQKDSLITVHHFSSQKDIFTSDYTRKKNWIERGGI